MYDYSKLVGRMKEKHYTQETLANAIGITGTSLCKKLNNLSRFTQPEMVSILNELDVPISEVSYYFFAK
jgi:DNA-binding XRE family transcriptional regulator